MFLLSTEVVCRLLWNKVSEPQQAADCKIMKSKNDLGSA